MKFVDEYRSAAAVKSLACAIAAGVCCFVLDYP